MPIHEFVCKNCHHQFEKLVFPNDPDPVCPECQNKGVEKILSAATVRPHGIPKGSGGYKAPACLSSKKGCGIGIPNVK